MPQGQLGGTPFRFAWEPLASSVPFHHPDLEGGRRRTPSRGSTALGLGLPSRSACPDHRPGHRPGPARRRHPGRRSSPRCWPDPTTGSARSPRAVPRRGLSRSSSARWARWPGQTPSNLRGRGALVIDPATTAGRMALFTPGSAPAIPETYERFAPRVVRDADGTLRLSNLHTRSTGRSPMILPGMTPSTAEAPIVVAAANGGHVAELAGGGQVTERIFTERDRRADRGPGAGAGGRAQRAATSTRTCGTCRSGRERLVQKARAAGAPFNGVTISAGIPDKAEALALLDELAAAGHLAQRVQARHGRPGPGGPGDRRGHPAHALDPPRGRRGRRAPLVGGPRRAAAVHLPPDPRARERRPGRRWRRSPTPSGPAPCSPARGRTPTVRRPCPSTPSCSGTVTMATA